MSNLVRIGNKTYQAGNTPQDKERETVTRNGVLAAGVTLLSVAGMGTIGVPLVSITGLGVLGLQLIGILTIAWDHVESSEKWEEMDNMTVPIEGIEGSLQNLEVLPSGIEYTETQLEVAKPSFSNVASFTPTSELKTVAVKPSFSNVASFTPTNNTNTTVIELEKTTEYQQVDIPKLVLKKMYSYALMGPSGSGKGMLLSNILRLIKVMHPGIHIFLLDPKDDPKERGYWEGVVDTWYRCDFNSLRTQAKRDFIDQAIDQYHAIEGPKLLIFDEATNLFGFMKNCAKDLLAETKSFLSGIASSGNSRNNYVWLLGHSGNLGDYGISGGEMSCFRKIYIAPMSNLEAIKQLGNTTFAGGKFGDEGMDYIKSVAKASDVDRAVYVGTIDSWVPMAKLENFSGYDRDTETFIKSSSSVQNQNSNKVTLNTSSVDGSILFDRALEIANKTRNVNLAISIWELSDSLDNPESIKKLEDICLSRQNS